MAIILAAARAIEKPGESLAERTALCPAKYSELYFILAQSSDKCGCA